MKRIITLTAALLLLTAINLVAQESPHQTKGDQYFDVFDYEKALSLYQLALEEDEFQPQVMRRIANTYRRLGDLEQCAEWYNKTIELDDSNAEDKLFYAEALKSLGRYDDAVYWYSKFAKEEPGDARAKSHTKDPFYYHDLQADSLKYRMQKLLVNSEKPAFGVCKFNDDYLFCAAGVNDDLAIRAQGSNDPFLNIYSAKRNSTDELVDAELLKGAVNSKYHDGPVCFDPENQIMYITRNNVKNGKPVLDENGNINLKIFSSKYENGKWGAVSELPFNSDAYSTGHASVSDDGNRLYFVSNMSGGYGGTDIYVTNKINGEWSTPRNLGSKVNTEGDEMFPFISDDGSIYFSSDGHAGLGGQDIFRCSAWGEAWAKAYNLGFPINTRHDDFSIRYETGDETGYFASDREGEGSDDIYFFSTLEIINQILAGTIQLEDENRSLAGERIKVSERLSGRVSESVLDEHNSFSVQVNEGDLIDIFMMSEDFNTEEPVFSVQIDDPLKDTYLNMGSTEAEYSEEYKEKMAVAQAKLIEQENAKKLAEAQRLAAEETERLAAEAEAQRLAAEETERLAAEAEAQRLATEETARLAAEAEAQRLAAEETERLAAEAEAQRLATEETARLTAEAEAQRLAAEETERLAAEAEAQRLATEETARLAAEAEAQRLAAEETERLAAEAEAQRLATEETARLTAEAEAQRLAAEETARLAAEAEAQRLADEEAARLAQTGENDARENMLSLKDDLNEMRADDAENAMHNADDQSHLLAQRSMNGEDAEKIFFAFDESYIGITASKVLDDIIDQMKADPSAVLFVDTHCDARGSDGYNNHLSEDRAQEIRRYMVWKGIDKSRLEFKWFGEDKLVNQCDNNTSCSSEEHKLNRRAELFLSNQHVAVKR